MSSSNWQSDLSGNRWGGACALAGLVERIVEDRKAHRVTVSRELIDDGLMSIAEFHHPFDIDEALADHAAARAGRGFRGQ